MNKLTTGILAGVVLIGASAAYMPVKVGETVQTQLKQAVQSVNEQPSSAFQIDITDYQKSAYSSEVITRIALKDPMLQADQEPTYIDIQHSISHGINKAKFTSKALVNDQIKAIVDEEFNGQIPLHFDGELSADTAIINTYLDGFTLQPESQGVNGPTGGDIEVKPAIFRLNYNQATNHYTLNGAWNGANLSADNEHLSLGNLKIKITGQQLSDYIWRYQSNLSLSQFDFGNEIFNLNSQQINLSDNFDIQESGEQANTIAYNSTLSLNSLSAKQFQQSLIEMKPSQISYSLNGPSVGSTEALIEASQNVNSEQMTQEDAQVILPLFTNFLQALNLDIHTLNLVTSDGSINGNVNLNLEGSSEELTQAMSFPPLMANFLVLSSDLTISKNLVTKMMPLQSLAMQLYQRDAYKEEGEDMIVKARLKEGQLTLNDVLF